MDSYLMMLYVTLDQESALKSFFSQQGWAFLKPDLSVITDKLGPVMSLSTQTPVPAQATCTFPAETDIFSTVPENSVHIVTETDSLSAVPENTIHIQLETLDQPEVKSRSSRKRNTKSDQTKPSAKFPRLKLQLENKSGSAELPEKEQSKHIIQTENATYEPVFVDNVNRIIVKEESVDSDYEPDNDDNDNVNDSESTDTCIDESFKQTSADNDASGSRDVTEGDGEQDDETGAGTEERVTQKQRKARYPNKSKKYRSSYSHADLKSAFLAVKEGNMSVMGAAKKYNVPESTLRERTNGKTPLEVDFLGPSTLFSKDEESEFIAHLKKMTSFGYGYTTEEMVKKASNFAVYLGKRSKADGLSTKWFRGLMKRWPGELNNMYKKVVSKGRAHISLEQAFNDYFVNLDSVLTENSLNDKPEYIYNFDEVGIQFRDQQPTLINEDDPSDSTNSTITTLLLCGNASGVLVPPYFVFEGSRMNQALVKDSAPGASGTVTEDGLLDSDTFYHYLNDHFLKHVQRPSKEQPVLILLDGYRSHVNITSLRLARENNVIIHMLPVNTSQYLSPMGTALIDLFQQKYISECHKFLKSCANSQGITKFNVGNIAGNAYCAALSPENLKQHFEKTGIYPFQPFQIDA